MKKKWTIMLTIASLTLFASCGMVAKGIGGIAKVEIMRGVESASAKSFSSIAADGGEHALASGARFQSIRSGGMLEAGRIESSIGRETLSTRDFYDELARLGADNAYMDDSNLSKRTLREGSVSTLDDGEIDKDTWPVRWLLFSTLLRSFRTSEAYNDKQTKPLNPRDQVVKDFALLAIYEATVLENGHMGFIQGKNAKLTTRIINTYLKYDLKTGAKVLATLEPYVEKLNALKIFNTLDSQEQLKTLAQKCMVADKELLAALPGMEKAKLAKLKSYL